MLIRVKPGGLQETEASQSKKVQCNIICWLQAWFNISAPEMVHYSSNELDPHKHCSRPPIHATPACAEKQIVGMSSSLSFGGNTEQGGNDDARNTLLRICCQIIKDGTWITSMLEWKTYLPWNHHPEQAVQAIDVSYRVHIKNDYHKKKWDQNSGGWWTKAQTAIIIGSMIALFLLWWLVNNVSCSSFQKFLTYLKVSYFNFQCFSFLSHKCSPNPSIKGHPLNGITFQRSIHCLISLTSRMLIPESSLIVLVSAGVLWCSENNYYAWMNWSLIFSQAVFLEYFLGSLSLLPFSGSSFLCPAYLISFVATWTDSLWFSSLSEWYTSSVFSSWAEGSIWMFWVNWF